MAKDKKKTAAKKHGVRLVKATRLTKKELAKLNLEELWVIDPTQGKAKIKARLCGCRNVCLA